ncbi:MAG: hypothetical protein AB7V62_08980 [Thermoleophilia bacterium]
MRGRSAGQASLELLALVPLLLLAALVAWQLAAVLGAGMRAQQEARAEALAATGAGVETLTATRTVPVVVPGVRGLRITARAAVRVP